MTITGWRLALGLSLLLLLGAGVTQAAPHGAEKQARRLFTRAEAYFKAGDFAAALTEYRAGYEKLPLPGFLINIAQCQRRLGDLVEARTTYRKFIVVAPDSPYVDDVKTLIAELDKLVDEAQREPSGAKTPAAPAGETGASPQAPPRPNNKVVPPTAAPAPVPAEAAHTGLVNAPKLPSAPAKTGTRWWLWGTLGVAVVGGAAAAYVLRSPSTVTIHEGSLGTLRR
jgi:tetratricopeptide (TPR) repeat protein